MKAKENAKFDINTFVRDHILELRVMTQRGLLRAKYHPSSEKTPFLVVSGENATGKSLVTRLVGWISKDLDMPFFSTSMWQRAGLGSNPMRTLMYGDESEESTGATSAQSVLKIFKTSDKCEEPHLILFDEPSLGLSPAYAKAMGQLIRNFLLKKNPLVRGVVMVSHDITLLQEAVDVDHHFLRLLAKDERKNTKGPTDIQSLLQMPPPVVNLEELSEHANKLWRAIHNIKKKDT